MQFEYYLSSIKRNKIKILILPIIIAVIQFYHLQTDSEIYALDIIYKTEASSLEQISNTTKLISSNSVMSAINEDYTQLYDIKAFKESSTQIKISIRAFDEKNLVLNAHKINSFIIKKIKDHNSEKIDRCTNDIISLISVFTTMSGDSNPSKAQMPDKEINLHPVSCTELFHNTGKLIYLHSGVVTPDLSKNLFKAILISLKNDIKSINDLKDKPVLLENYVGLPVSNRESKSKYIHILLSFLVLLAGISFINAFLEKQIYEIK